MSGEAKGAQRDQLLEERDARIVEQLRRKVPIKVIALMEGLEPDYTGKICAALTKEHGIVHTPGVVHENEVPPGLSSRTDKFRRNASMKLDLWKIRNKKHFLEVCRDVGLTQAAQRAATKSHGPYDWHLSQLDRWAEALGVSFEELMLDLMFDPVTAERMKQCLSPK